MKAKLTRRQMSVAGVVLVLLLGGLAIGRIFQRPVGVGVKEKAVYYCPMHPTYTSDRPGDCPICYMRLVKRQRQAPPPPAPTVKRFEDICYLHNCPKIHEGRPCPMLVVAKVGEKVTCPVCGTHVAEGEPFEARPAQARPVEGRPTEAKPTEAGPSRPKRILYWTDPMIPGYKSDKPGKSPMGMDLVPVYEEEAPAAGPEAVSAGPEAVPVGPEAVSAGPEAVSAGPGAIPSGGYAPVLISPKKQQLIGVKTALVERRRLFRTIRTVGRIAYDPELYQVQAEYLQAVKALKRAQAGSGPEAAIGSGIVEQASGLVEAARVRLRLLGLSDSFIDEVGRWEKPDQSLLLADPEGRVWLYAPIYEFELPLVHVGQMIRVENPAVPGRRWEGIIRSIDPVLDPATRSARARALITDPEKGLKPEMYLNASIEVDRGEVLAVQKEAIFDTGLRRIAFVDRGQGVFEPREVFLGMEADGFTEVKQGLLPGERVVVSGNFLIDSESRLKAALEGMAPTTEDVGIGSPPAEEDRAEPKESGMEESRKSGRGGQEQPGHSHAH